MHIKQKTGISNTAKMTIIIGVAESLRFLHKQNIIHGALETSNILLDEGLKPHLLSFGIGPIEESMSSLFSRGCPAFMSPEKLKGGKITNKTDIFSFGMLLYHLITETRPFENVNNSLVIPGKIINGERPTIPSGSMNDLMKNIIEQCWNEVPENRPTIAEIADYIEEDPDSVMKDLDVNPIKNYYIELQLEASEFEKRKHASPQKLNEKHTTQKTQTKDSTPKGKNSKESKKETAKDNDKNTGKGNNKENAKDNSESDSKENMKGKSTNSPSKQRATKSASPLKQSNKEVHLSKASEKNDDMKNDVISSMSLTQKPVLPMKNENNSTLKSNCTVAHSQNTNKIIKVNSTSNDYEFSFSSDSDIYSDEINPISDSSDISEINTKIKNSSNSQQSKNPEFLFTQTAPIPPQLNSNSTNLAASTTNPSHDDHQTNTSKAKELWIKMEKITDPDEKSKLAKDIAKILRRATEQNDPEGTYLYGKCHEEGIGIQKSLVRAAKQYMKAADYGHQEAQLKIAQFLEKGIGIDKDLSRAFKYYEKCANKGNSEANYHAGRFLYEGIHCNNKPNLKEASKFLKFASNNRVVKAMVLYGKVLEKYPESSPNHLEKAFEMYKKASDNNDLEGSVEYARCLLSAIGTTKDARRGLSIFEKAAKAGSSEACYELGMCLLNGNGTAANSIDAASFFKKAADLKNPKGQFMLGKCLLEGKGIKQNLRDGLKYLKQAADNNYDQALNYYGRMILKGKHVRKDVHLAFNYFKKSAKLRSPEGLCLYGKCFLNGIGVSVDPEEAGRYFKAASDQNSIIGQCYYGKWLIDSNQELEAGFSLLEKAAESDDVYAKYTLGKMYYKYHTEATRAADLFEEASQKDDAKARLYYGRCLRNGFGVRKNLKEALRQFKKSADKGYAKAQFKYAQRCSKDTPDNPKDAIKYYKLAADQGFAKAQFYYGQCLKDGYGLEEDLVEAAKYFKLAADNGNSEAQNSYGDFLENGIGVKENIEEAVKYYKMSADQGDAYGLNNYAIKLLEGIGVENQDVELALRLQKQSAEKGCDLAMYSLGIFYLAEKDFDSALKYLRDAIEKGNTDAKIDYGRMLMNGWGVKQDFKQAESLFIEGLETNPDFAKTLLKELAEKKKKKNN